MPESDSRGTPLATLYQEMILDHYRRPRNKAARPDADVTVERTNPLCGDLIELSLARASFYIYNDESDIEALLGALKHARELFGHAGV